MLFLKLKQLNKIDTILRQFMKKQFCQNIRLFYDNFRLKMIYKKFDKKKMIF